MLPILQVGPVAVPVPPLVLLLGFWLGLSAVEKFAPRLELSPSAVYNLAFVGLVAGLIGARLAYVLRYPQAFAANPLNVFARDLGLFDPWGGLAAGLVSALIYGQRKKLPFWRTLDALTPGLAVFAVAIGLSHLASGSAFGAPTQMPWGIPLWGARRQPTQIFEILIALAIWWAVAPTSRRLPASLPPGVRFFAFLALSAAARLFLEAFRGDSLVVLNGVRAAQLVAWLVLGASLWGMARLSRSPSEESSLE